MLPIELANSTETGQLNVLHLKRFWSKAMLKRNGQLPATVLAEEWNADTTLLKVLGLGLEQTMVYLYQQAPAFPEFEAWILDINGGSLVSEKVAQFNTELQEGGIRVKAATATLSSDDQHFWDEHGYLIIRKAVTREDCDHVITAICDFLDLKRDDPSTWYQPHPAKQGIMVQLFQHPALEKNRNNPNIRRVYEALWQREDIWVTTDRVSFNPPENDQWHFPGPNLHWDTDLSVPISFGLQGLLYLSDTKESQGAFTLVPGFHKKIALWLKELPAGANPAKENLYALGAKPIAAEAGDFIVWHHALPHGSSPNTSDVPRIVQYINYSPLYY